MSPFVVLSRVTFLSPGISNILAESVSTLTIRNTYSSLCPDHIGDPSLLTSRYLQSQSYLMNSPPLFSTILPIFSQFSRIGAMSYFWLHSNTHSTTELITPKECFVFFYRDVLLLYIFNISTFLMILIKKLGQDRSEDILLSVLTKLDT